MKQKHISGKRIPTKKPPSQKPERKNSFERLETALEKHHRNIFYGLLIASLLVSILLFDVKLSIGGDDAAYIQRGWQFLHQGIFPYFQGPGYPVFLSLFISFLGMSVIKLKIVSLLCYNAFLVVTYLAFRKRVPNLVLFALLSFIAFNSYLQYYSSQTYTESFFLFLEGVCILSVFKIIEAGKSELSFAGQIKNNYGKWIGFGILFTILSLTKTIAFVCIGSVLIYFILQKQYKEAVLALIFFILARGVYEICVRSIYGPEDYGQFELMLRVNPYKPELGHETISGMFNRLYVNFIVFLSVRLYHLLNFPTSTSVTVNISIAYITGIIFLVFIVLSYRKNKYIFFLGVYSFVMAVGIFFGVPITNLQERLIVIIVHFIFIVFFYNIYLLAAGNVVSRTFLLISTVALVFFIVANTASGVADNFPVLKKNLSGDKYYGYSPDLINYIQICEWAGDSLPPNSVILCRKPEMSFVFANGKQKFEGIYNVSTTNPDSVALEWKSKKITHVILAKLRATAEKNDGNFVNPAMYMLIPYHNKYPEKVNFVKNFGDTEVAQLYEVKY